MSSFLLSSQQTVARSESGRLFHARGAATANVRSPVMNTCTVQPHPVCNETEWRTAIRQTLA